MNYIGNLCQGCNGLLGENDDIVVCPECGTPQHRECYEKENRCVNSEKHAEGYVWQGEKPQKVFPEPQKSETIACPNCGYENPKGTPVCKQCGMKFTIFGMNVVDAMHEQENPDTEIPGIPDYSPPFTLGEGEGFDENENKVAQQVEELLINIMAANGQTESEDGCIRLAGPFPDSDRIDGVRTNTVGNFIGSNAMSYIDKFKKLESGKKLSFNFAAALFSPIWFFYRKLYKAGIFFMTLFLSLNIVFYPSIYSATEKLAELRPLLATVEKMTDAEYAAFSGQVMSAAAPIYLYSFINFGIMILCGLIANRIYKKYVISHSQKIEKLTEKNQAMKYIVKNGGASLVIAAAAFFAQYLVTSVVSYFL